MPTDMLQHGIMFANVALAGLLAGSALIIALAALSKVRAPVRVRRR